MKRANPRSAEEKANKNIGQTKEQLMSGSVAVAGLGGLHLLQGLVFGRWLAGPFCLCGSMGHVLHEGKWLLGPF